MDTTTHHEMIEDKLKCLCPSCVKELKELTRDKSLIDRLEDERHQDARFAVVERERDQARAERDGWEQTAAQHLRNEFFYRDIIIRIGEPFGVAAKTSDDGSIQQDVLALRVPELVANLRQELARADREIERLNIVNTALSY